MLSALPLRLCSVFNSATVLRHLSVLAGCVQYRLLYSKYLPSCVLPWEQENSSSVIFLINPVALITLTLNPSVLHLQIYNEKKSQFEIKRNNPKDLVERVARDISKLLNSKRKALEVRQWCSIYYNTCGQTCTIHIVHTHTETHVLCFMTTYVKLSEHKHIPIQNNTLVIISYCLC